MVLQLTKSDSEKLERLIRAEFEIAKWDDGRGPNYDPFNLSRHEFLVDEILSVSGAARKLKRIGSSNRVLVIENTLKELRKLSRFNSNAIMQLIEDQVKALKKDPGGKYTAVWPIAVSLDFSIKTPKSYLVDGNFIALLKFGDYVKKYLPRKQMKKRKVADSSSLVSSGFDLVNSLLKDPAFLVTEVYARDPWQCVLESGNRVELFLSLADLAGQFWTIDSHPISPYPDPTVCFVFEKPMTIPKTFGRWIQPESFRSFVFQPTLLAKVLKTTNSFRNSDIWPVTMASLVSFRRAMSRSNRENCLVNFWTACKIATAAGDRNLRDVQVAQIIKRVYKRSWTEFPAQVARFLSLRNKLLHEGISDIMWYDIQFARHLFEDLIAIHFDHARKGKTLAKLRATFAVAKLDAKQRESMLEALQESIGSS